jgi:lipopolysaccharide export system permease protein
MRSQDIAGSASVPYRRETFGTKRIVLDFDGDFNLADVSGIAASAKAKSIRRIYHDLDSIREYNDSVAHAFFSDAQYSAFRKPPIEKKDSLKAVALAVKKTTDFDSLYSKLSTEEKQRIVKLATDNARNTQMDLEVKSEYSRLLNRNERLHSLEALGKITLALSCIIFFFIGAPLGAIIRKGGLGVPVIISVIVFIVFYIFDNTGFRMAREDEWTVWFGRWLGTAVLTPIAVFFTYKANNDSVVFNIDLYKNIIMRMLGLRLKRNLTRKEVIIEDPDYAKNRAQLVEINSEIDRYIREHKLLKWPNPIKVFFRPGDDHDIAEINERLEETVENLSYTKDSVILNELNNIPIIATHAHTRPFVRKWLNIITGIILPLGLFFYIRMLRFRFRLYRDLKNMRQASDAIIARIDAAHTAL